MKKTLSLTFLALLCLEVNAQLQKGNILVGGSVSFSTTSNDQEGITSDYHYKNTQFGVDPRAGYFLSDRGVAGLGLGFFASHYTADNASSAQENKGNDFSISPFYRFYFPLGDKIALFVHSSASLGFSKVKIAIEEDNTEDENYTSKGTSYSVGVNTGLNYFLSEKWALEATFGSIRYNAAKTDRNDQYYTESEFKSSGLQFNLGIESFSFGLKYFIVPQ
jgi:outer membrane protein